MDSYKDVSEQCCGQRCGHSHCKQHDSMAYNCPESWKNAPPMSPARPGSACAGMMPDYNMDYPMPDYPITGNPMPAGMSFCTDTSAGPLEQNYPIAMAYVPWQQWSTPYTPDQALKHGTIFPELDLEFIYGRCSR